MKENLINHNPDTALQRPDRGPIEIPELLIPYYEGKKVVEIGFAGGDYIPIWAAHAKEVIGYEADESRFAVASAQENIKNLDNVFLLSQIVTPEEIIDADFYYGWSTLPLPIEFIDRLKSAGKKGTFAFYGGWAERDLSEHTEGGNMCFRTEKELEELNDCEVIYFKSKELDNRPQFDNLSKTNEYTIIIKHF